MSEYYEMLDAQLWNAVNQAKDDFKNGRSVGEEITVDEVEMTFFDDWRLVGTTRNEAGEEVELYTPFFYAEGDDFWRLFLPGDIDGFTPVMGHEYKLMVRRIYLTDQPLYHYYKLIRVISDNKTNKNSLAD